MPLQFHMSAEPFFQVAPRTDFVVDRRSAILNLVKISLEHFVNQTFLAFEVVIELPFSGSRSLDDVIGAGRTRSLLVKQVCCRTNNSQASFRAPDETCLHTCSFDVPTGITYAARESGQHFPISEVFVLVFCIRIH